MTQEEKQGMLIEQRHDYMEPDADAECSCGLPCVQCPPKESASE